MDEGNRYFFGGKIEEKTVEGWGYKRYVVVALGPMAGTLMAVDPAAPKVSRFVALGGAGHGCGESPRLGRKACTAGPAGVRWCTQGGPTFMVTAGIKEVRQHFTEYLAKVERGEEVIITRRNEPVARISPVKSPGSGRLASRRKLRESIVPKGKTLSRIVIGSREDGSF